MTGANPICETPNYRQKVFDIFASLLSLDGVRKAVTMSCNMIEAVPEDEEIKVDYDTGSLAWYDNTGEIEQPNNALAVRFENTIYLRREEKEL